MQPNKPQGIAAPRWARVRSPLASRDSGRKPSISPGPRKAPCHSASTQGKLLGGLFDPLLKADQLEADERRRRHLLKERRRFGSRQQTESPSFRFTRRQRAHQSHENVKTQALRAYNWHKSWKRGVTPGETDTGGTSGGELRRESRSESSHTEKHGSLVRSRPIRQWSRPVQPLKGEALGQLALSTLQLEHPLEPERSESQSSREHHTQQKQTHSRPDRRKMLCVADRQNRPDADRTFSDIFASRACCEQKVKWAQRGLSSTYLTVPDMKLSGPLSLSNSIERKKPLLFQDAAKPSKNNALQICSSSCGCHDRSDRTPIWQVLFPRRKNPTSHIEWLHHLDRTCLRVEELCSLLTTCVSFKRQRTDCNALRGTEELRSLSRLESLLFSLADTLRSGPPGGTLQETTLLLEFLRQQSSSALCAGRMRRLLNTVLLSLRRKFQGRGQKATCCKRLHTLSEQATCPFKVIEGRCLKFKGALDKPQCAKKSDLHGNERQKQVIKWSARSPKDQRLIDPELRNAGYKTGIPVAVQQATDRRSTPSTPNNAAAIAATQVLSGAHSLEATIEKDDGSDLVRSRALSFEEILVSKPRSGLREDSREREVLTAPVEALRCLLRLGEVDARAAATLHVFEQPLGVDNPQRKPAAFSVERHCASHQKVSPDQSDACKPVVLPAPCGHPTFPTSANYSRDCRKAANEREPREESGVQGLSCPHFPRLVQRVAAFREVRLGLQALSVPSLYEEGLQQELRQLEGILGVCKHVDNGVAGLWTLQAATAEHVLQRELQQVLHLVNGAVAAFIERILAVEASRMAKVAMQKLVLPQHE